MMTVSKDAPRPKVRICDALDADITALLGYLSIDGAHLDFAIDRSGKDCRTPRRNADANKALVLLKKMEILAKHVIGYLMNMFQLQKQHGLDLASLNDKSVFVAAVPLFAKRQHQPSDESVAAGLVSLPAPRDQSAALPRWSTLMRFVGEQKRSLSEKLVDLAKVGFGFFLSFFFLFTTKHRRFPMVSNWSRWQRPTWSLR